MKIDLFSFTQGETQTISHMSQAIGLMAELDVGTENWRWMGDVRFFLGFLRGRKGFFLVEIWILTTITSCRIQKMPSHFAN